MNYSNVGIFTGKIYYFDPDEKLSHIILFHNGQADTYFAPVASGNASGGELLMDDEITEDEYNDLPDDIKTLYWYDRKSGKYILCRFRMDWYCECHNSYVAIDIDNARSHGDV